MVLQQLLNLGNKIVENFEDEKIEKIFLDVDFKERTILKIVTDNGFEPIFASYKINVLLNEIWEGKNSYECDGQLSDFSLINHLLENRV